MQSGRRLMLEYQFDFARVVRDHWADVKIISYKIVHTLSDTDGGVLHYLGLKLDLHYGEAISYAHLTIAHGHALVGADPPRPKQLKKLQDSFRLLDVASLKRRYTFAPNFATSEPIPCPHDDPHRVLLDVHRSSLLHDRLISIHQQACAMYRITEARDGFHLSIDWVVNQLDYVP
jgi:hypothetical protein